MIIGEYWLAVSEINYSTLQFRIKLFWIWLFLYSHPNRIHPFSILIIRIENVQSECNEREILLASVNKTKLCSIGFNAFQLHNITTLHTETNKAIVFLFTYKLKIHWYVLLEFDWLFVNVFNNNKVCENFHWKIRFSTYVLLLKGSECLMYNTTVICLMIYLKFKHYKIVYI